MPDILHADLIRAVLDGKVVQHRLLRSDDEWMDFPSVAGAIVAMVTQHGQSRLEFRLKSEPVVKWTSVCPNKTNTHLFIEGFEDEAAARADAKQWGGKVQRTEYDPDTLDVISAKTEAP